MGLLRELRGALPPLNNHGGTGSGEAGARRGFLGREKRPATGGGEVADFAGGRFREERTAAEENGASENTSFPADSSPPPLADETGSFADESPGNGDYLTEEDAAPRLAENSADLWHRRLWEREFTRRGRRPVRAADRTND